MIVRQCAGGVVFYANKVLLVKNDRGEWTLPKGKIHQNELKHSSAVLRVKDETGVEASILETAGNTMYQFFSRSRQQEVCNAITWYIMQTDSNDCILKDEFIDGGFYKVKEAIDMLTHSQEKYLVDISYNKYKELRRNSIEDDLATN